MNKCVNNCINNKCSNCGQCCIPYLPMTYEELDIIKQYVSDNNIKPISIFEDNNCYIDCPFHDRKNKKCIIYPARPAVCREFMCNKDKSFAKYYDDRAEINGSTGTLYPLDLLVYDNPTTLLMIAQSVLKDRMNEKTLKEFLLRTHNEDIVKAIDDGQIKLEWR